MTNHPKGCIPVAVPVGDYSNLQFTLAHVALGMIMQLVSMRSLNRRSDGQLIFDTQKVQVARILEEVSGASYYNKRDISAACRSARTGSMSKSDRPPHASFSSRQPT